MNVLTELEDVRLHLVWCNACLEGVKNNIEKMPISNIEMVQARIQKCLDILHGEAGC